MHGSANGHPTSDDCEKPFAWLLKPSLLNQPAGSLVYLLQHLQIEVLSESLQVAYNKIFEEQAMEKKRKKFRAEANRSPQRALDRIHELASLAVLRFRQWQFLEYEPTGKKGRRSPDHLMIAIEGPRVLVEVATIHLPQKIEMHEQRKQTLRAAIGRALLNKGIEAEVNIYCSYNQLPPTPKAFRSHFPALIAEISKNLKHSHLHSSLVLPNKGRIDVNIKGKAEELFKEHAHEKIQEVEDVRQKIARDLGEFRLKLGQGGDFRRIYGQRIATVVQKKDKQIIESGIDLPAVVALCIGHHDTSIREAVEGYRHELRKRGTPHELKAVKAILLLSLFNVEMERLYASVSKHPITKAMATPVHEGGRKLPVAAVDACWIPLAPQFKVKPIGRVWDVNNFLGQGDANPPADGGFALPIFPKMVAQKGLEPVPPGGLSSA